MKVELAKEQLLSKLRNSIGKNSGSIKTPYLLLFSGGLDSSILAKLLLERGDVIGFTLGVDGKGDILAAREFNQALESTPAEHSFKLVELEVNIENVERALPEVVGIIDTAVAMTVTLAAVTYLSLEGIHKWLGKNGKGAEGSIKEAVFSGQGADELFGGYNRYLRKLEGDPIALREDMKADLMRIVNENGRNDKAIARHLGFEPRLPFLEPKIVEYAQGLDTHLLIRDQRRKWILREAAREIGVPDCVLEKEKKAFQYGSRVSYTMNKVAKRNDMKIGDYLLALTDK